MKKLLGILVLSILLCSGAYAIEEEKLLTEKDLENIQSSQSKFEEILEFFKESIDNNKPIEPESAALQFGYKNFEEFAREYLKIMNLTDISVDEIREFLSGTDETVIIDQSQENLDKLYSLIMNDKYFIKKNTYYKTFKKGKYDGNQISMMALAVYINYEKEMAKITKDQNLKQISRFTWGWGYSWGTGSNPYKYALKECEEDAKKHKLFGGKCIIVDWRNKSGRIENRLKLDPIIEEKNEILLAKKNKLDKEKKKKKVEKITEAKIPVDLVIPVQVYIIQVNKNGYKTNTSQEEVNKDFKVANDLWSTKGIKFKLINVKKVEGNSKSIIKDLKWAKEKYATSLKIDRKKNTSKSNMKKKYRRILFKFIKGASNRNKNAINLFYIPYLPGEFACGIAYTYSRVVDSRADKFKRQNKGLVVIAERTSRCGPTGEVLAHELGHMFSLGHKESSNDDLMMWGTGRKIHDWQNDKVRKYHNKYLKRTLAIN